MTTGHRVTCEDMIRELPDFLDRELPTIRLAELQEHLDECARCLRKHQFEASVLDQIRSRLTNIGLPPSLQTRILELLSTDRAGGTPWRY